VLRSVLIVDIRRYPHRHGRWLVADRISFGGLWTPLVRVRLSLPRASDGGTEI